MSKVVGVLAIQGDIEAHGTILDGLGVEVRPVLFNCDLDAVDALILPGGESTTISKGLDRLNLYKELDERINAGLPVLGTCAGAILLAQRVKNHPVRVLGVMDVTVIRNAYGTQVDSFAAPIDSSTIKGLEGFHCIFIRAPQFHDLGPNVEVLATVRGEPVLLREGCVLATAFHPELTDNPQVHQILLELT